jgi:hypothetical protein
MDIFFKRPERCFVRKEHSLSMTIRSLQKSIIALSDPAELRVVVVHWYTSSPVSIHAMRLYQEAAAQPPPERNPPNGG